MRHADPSLKFRAPSPPWWGLTVLGASFTFAVACGSGGNPQTGGTGGAINGSGGASATGGISATGGAGVGGAAATGGVTGVGGAVVAGTGGGRASGGGGSCAARTGVTLATHEVLNVTWPAGPATLAGSGPVHLWGKMTLTAAGDVVSGSSRACGTILPATDLSPALGGAKILIEIPLGAWDAATASHVQVDGTQTGWNVGDTLSYRYDALVGLSQIASDAVWPASYADLAMTSDVEGDGLPGVTGVPRTGTGYLLPPTSALGAISVSPRADRLYLVDRNAASTVLAWTSCDAAAGSTTFTHFDNHVVGCHVAGGAECTPVEVRFIDDNRTVYSVTAATTSAQVIAESATCGDVRKALPM